MLKDVMVRNAKPKAKLYRLFDGEGLYLEVQPAGGKYWRLKYRFLGNADSTLKCIKVNHLAAAI